MTSSINHPRYKKGMQYRLSAFVILPILIFFSYSNTFNSPWILDDHHNILNQPFVHIELFDSESIWEVLKSSFSAEKLDRPFARLSFALNWYLGGKDPWGYHLVNITIHTLCSFLLFLTIRTLCRTPRGRTNEWDPDWVSLVAAVLWAVNPIQTQAVTYIVQRMASLACLFYLFGLLSYIRGRLSDRGTESFKWFVVCSVAFVLAVSSKENAVMLPLSVLLVEFVFFSKISARTMPRKSLLIASGVVGLVVAAAIALFIRGDVFSIFNYESRYFTISERLLTQPRILLFYLSQIFYPAPFRLSIEHDVTLSTTLFDPWTTLPSIMIIAVLVCVAVVKAKEWPYVSFAILFFFLNHLIESSVIPLELIFEHRNYLPSMFLFVPVAQGLSLALQRYRKRAQAMHTLVGAFCALLVLGFAFGTYVRNQAWESPASLWADAAVKAPKSGRALAYMAMLQAEQPERADRALALYAEALKQTKTNRFLESEIYNNMAALHYGRHDFGKAAELWEGAVKSRPGFLKARYCLALALTQTNQIENAFYHLDRVISEDGNAVPARNLRGCIYFMRNDLDNALKDFRAVMASPEYQLTGIVNAGAVQVASGHYAKAEAFLRAVPGKSKVLLPALLWQLKSSFVQKDQKRIEAGLDRIANLQSSKVNLAELSSLNRISLADDQTLLPAFHERELSLLINRMASSRLHSNRVWKNHLSFN